MRWYQDNSSMVEYCNRYRPSFVFQRVTYNRFSADQLRIVRAVRTKSASNGCKMTLDKTEYRYLTYTTIIGNSFNKKQIRW